LNPSNAFGYLYRVNPPTPSQPGFRHYRWVICALLFYATTVNYVDRQILSLIKETLDQQLGWSNADFGRVNGAFQGAYGVGLLVFGWFIDKFGTKIGYAVSISAWSLAAMGHAFVASVTGFFTARVMLGLGEGGNFPSAIKGVALWFPKRERALATSIFNAGTNVGAILAPALVPWIVSTWGWQSAFVAAGIAGLVWLGLWLPLYNVPEKIKRLNQDERDYINSDQDEQATDAAGQRGGTLLAGLFSFTGRIPRATFWGITIALTGLSLVFGFVLADLFRIAGSTGEIVSSVIRYGWAVVAIWISIAIQIKRWHDLDKSGWLVLLNLIPGVGSLISLVYLGFLGGVSGGNRHGPEPHDPGLLGHRQTWSFIVAKFMTDPIWWFFLIWLPDYFKQTRGLDIKKSWLLLVTIYSIITVLSIAGGWVTGHLVRRGWSVTRARKTGMFAFACCVLPILAVTHVGNWAAVLLIALAGSAHQAWSANLFTTVSDMFPKRAVASVVGIGGLAGAFCGIYFPIYCGKILDQFKAANNITGGYAILFSICGFAYLVTFAVHHLLAPKFEPIRLRNPET
jgi:MFS family permease